MTGEAVLCLWWAFGLLNHLKRRKHSRLKGSQLDLITWYFQDVRPTTFLSSFSMYPIPYPVHFRSFDKNQTSAGSGPRPPTDHRCQNCQPVVLTGGGGKGEGEWLVSCFFFYHCYSKHPPETSWEKESDSLVERYEVLTAFLREGGKPFQSLWMSHVILSSLHILRSSGVVDQPDLCETYRSSPIDCQHIHYCPLPSLPKAR